MAKPIRNSNIQQKSEKQRIKTIESTQIQEMFNRQNELCDRSSESDEKRYAVEISSKTSIENGYRLCVVKLPKSGDVPDIQTKIGENTVPMDEYRVDPETGYYELYYSEAVQYLGPRDLSNEFNLSVLITVNHKKIALAASKVEHDGCTISIPCMSQVENEYTVCSAYVPDETADEHDVSMALNVDGRELPIMPLGKGLTQIGLEDLSKSGVRLYPDDELKVTASVLVDGVKVVCLSGSNKIRHYENDAGCKISVKDSRIELRKRSLKLCTLRIVNNSRLFTSRLVMKIESSGNIISCDDFEIEPGKEKQHTVSFTYGCINRDGMHIFNVKVQDAYTSRMLFDRTFDTRDHNRRDIVFDISCVENIDTSMLARRDMMVKVEFKNNKKVADDIRVDYQFLSENKTDIIHVEARDTAFFEIPVKTSFFQPYSYHSLLWINAVDDNGSILKNRFKVNIHSQSDVNIDYWIESVAGYVDSSIPCIENMLRIHTPNLETADDRCLYNNVYEEIKSVYDFIRGLNMEYKDPVKYNGKGYQSISLPQTVYEEREGNCIELSLLLASAFEAYGLEPVILFLRNRRKHESHAVVGVVMRTNMYRSRFNLQSEFAHELRKGMKRLDVLFIESTDVTYADKTLEDAISDATMAIDEHADDGPLVDSICMVTKCRMDGLHPFRFRFCP